MPTPMPWQAQLRGDPLPWLLEPEPPGVRLQALRHLLGLPSDDPEVKRARDAAHRAGPIATILAEMDEAGWWVRPGPGYNPKYRSTVWSLVMLAQLGASIEEDLRIATACAYLLDHALAAGGQFSATGSPSGTIDCLQGNLLWALVELGCEDPRLDAAYEWMARTVTGEGIAPASDKQAAARYYAYKCGPTFACGANDKRPCAWGATKVMLAFGALPAARRTLPVVRQHDSEVYDAPKRHQGSCQDHRIAALVERAIAHGVEFLLGVDPATAAYPSGYSDRPSGNWWKFGFPVFYVTDILQIVEALVALGYGQDPRLANALALIRSKQDAQGRWPLEYGYSGKTWVDFGAKKQPNKWVTLRALRVLKAGCQ